MAGTTLVRTTLTGVRPLGVRGEPLHATHEQIRGVIRRRLGERHARLLAEPQPDDVGRRIDWYSDVPGSVVPLSALPEPARSETLAQVGALIADIAALGAQLQQAPSSDARITGRALELACRRPSDDYVFVVGEQPVVVCWGYEPDAAGALLPPAFPARTPAVAEPVPPAAPIAAPPPPPAPVVAAATPFPWLGWLLASALAVVLALTTAYVLRQFLPEQPVVAVTQLPPPPAPPAPPPPPNPLVGLQSALGDAQAEAEKLRATLASLRDEFAAKRAACPPPPKPPEPPPPKPPQVVEKKPDPPPPPPPPPPKPPQEPILKLPPKATNDYSFLKGCWRGDSFRYTPRHAPGYHTYCFDENGNGQLVFVWQSGTTCTAPARARFQGDTLQIADADTTCSDGSPWSQDRLLCRPDAAGIAQCSGETNLPGPGGRRNPATSFTVRLHRR